MLSRMKAGKTRLCVKMLLWKMHLYKKLSYNTGCVSVVEGRKLLYGCTAGTDTESIVQRCLKMEVHTYIVVLSRIL